MCWPCRHGYLRSFWSRPQARFGCVDTRFRGCRSGARSGDRQFPFRSMFEVGEVGVGIFVGSVDSGGDTVKPIEAEPALRSATGPADHLYDVPIVAGYQSPPWTATLAEVRAWGEYACLVAMWPLLDRGPRGDGHSVIVYPGFLAGDASTVPLRRYLRLLAIEPGDGVWA